MRYITTCIPFLMQRRNINYISKQSSSAVALDLNSNSTYTYQIPTFRCLISVENHKVCIPFQPYSCNQNIPNAHIKCSNVQFFAQFQSEFIGSYLYKAYPLPNLPNGKLRNISVTTCFKVHVELHYVAGAIFAQFNHKSREKKPKIATMDQKILKAILWDSEVISVY